MIKIRIRCPHGVKDEKNFDNEECDCNLREAAMNLANELVLYGWEFNHRLGNFEFLFEILNEKFQEQYKSPVTLNDGSVTWFEIL